MTDRLVVDLGGDGRVRVGLAPAGGLAEMVAETPLEWPLDSDALEDLRWYLEDYLRVPFGVYEERGPQVAARLGGWGGQIFGQVFGVGPGRDAYVRARASGRGVEVVFRSGSPGLLGLPWELMADPGHGTPLALAVAGMSRSLPSAELGDPFAVAGGRLRVLMVISRPAGERDVGFRMIARPLLGRLAAVRGQVDLVVLRPPTLAALRAELAEAVAAGEPFQVVHFDGHGVLAGRGTDGSGGGGGSAGPPWMYPASGGEGVLVFQNEDGSPDFVGAAKVAAVLRQGQVPVAVLNACQSGAVGKELEAAVATRLLRDGAASVVAMAYSVYAVAAAEFMTAFYEALFAGEPVSSAVTAGRRRLFERDGRPSPKGTMPLADWMVPVHYWRREVSFPGLATARPAGLAPLGQALDELREQAADPAAGPEGRPEDGADAGAGFVGRDGLFFELETAARLQRLIVLHGPGGTGKTELARAFAAWWRATGGVARPDWVFWHSFEPGAASFGLDSVVTRIGLALFGQKFALLEPDERTRLLVQTLRQQRMLLVWDNFETVRTMPDPDAAAARLDKAGCAALRDFLHQIAAPGGASAVLITSRTTEDWLGQVRRLPVAGLTPDEATEYAGLLLAPYPAAGPRRARSDFAELMEWLDGHPLSMRIILPLLDSAGPADLLAGLRGTAPLPAPDTGDRATSLPASITYSFRHLSPPTQTLLPAASLCQGVADSDLLAAFSGAEGVPKRFAGTTREAWEAVLTEAARVGLLTGLGSGMYRMHPALPGYLAAHWHTADPDRYLTERDAATRAMIAATASLANWASQQIAAGNARFAYQVLTLQHGTFTAMLDRALEARDWQPAQQITPALSNWWTARGMTAEADAWTDRVRLATEDPPGSPPPLDSDAGALWIFVVVDQANRQQTAMRFADAEITYRQILDLVQAQPSTPQQQSYLATTYHQLGNTAQDRGRPDEADQWYHKALTIKEELGNRPSLSLTYAQLALLAEERDQDREALCWAVRSVALFDEVPHYSTGTAPDHMASLAGRLGMGVLRECWREVTGEPLPSAVQGYVTQHQDQQGS